jgi:prolyl 4-hydroxylase
MAVKRRVREGAPVAQRPKIAKQKCAARRGSRNKVAQRLSACRAVTARYHRTMTTPGETSAAHLMAQPGVRRVPSPQVELFTLPGFLPGELCEALMALIDIDRRPSTIADPNGDSFFRTSETCDLDPGAPAVQEVEARLFALSGIDPVHGEPIQGQRYEAGQEFKAHTDYFEPGGEDFARYCSVAGQRTWTFMAYLNDVEAGGATRFKVIDKMFQQRRGMLVGWNNHRTDGSLNPATLHHAMKVRKGLKYVITKWYRERPWRWE